MAKLYRHQPLFLLALLWLSAITIALAQTVRGQITDATTETDLPAYPF